MLIRRLLSDFIFFFAFFPFYTSGLKDVGTIIVHIVALLIVLPRIRIITSSIKSDKRLSVAVFIYSILLMMSVVVPIVYGTNDYGFFKKVFSTGVLLPLRILAATAVTERFLKKKVGINDLLKYFIKSCLILVFSTIVFLVSPGLKGAWQSIVYIGSERGIASMELLSYASRFSIVGFMGFKYAFMMYLSFIFSFYLLMEGLFYKRWLGVVAVLASILGASFYGRTGLVLVAVSMVLLLPKIVSKIGGFRKLLMIIAGIALLSGSLYLFGRENVVLQKWASWSFSIIENLTENRIGDGSTDALKEQLAYRPSVETMLYGDGQYVDSETGGYYMGIDIGFMRNILFYGLFFSFLMYYLWFNLMRRMEDINNGSLWRTAVLLIAISAFLAEFKGECIEVLSALVFVAILVYCNNKKKQDNEINVVEVPGNE